MPATTRENTPRLGDGVMKRGTTWSYVIRVKDSETGISNRDGSAASPLRTTPRPHGTKPGSRPGTASTSTATGSPWRHTWTTGSKPTRWRSRRGLWPTTGPASALRDARIGHLPIQAVRPSTIIKLYRNLLTSGGRDDQPLAVATVTHLHAVLRKAFRDAVIVDELIGSNPVERAKRPRAQAQELARYGPSLSSGRSWLLHTSIGCSPSFTSRLTPGHVAASCSTFGGRDIDLDGKKITITGSTAVISGERVNGTTKSGRTRVVSIDDETVAVLRQRKADQVAERLKAIPGAGSWTGTCSRLDGASRSTPTPSRP
jgi:hypothetical protein